MKSVVWSRSSGVWSLRSGVSVSKSGIWSLRSGVEVWSLESEVLGLRFEV